MRLPFFTKKTNRNKIIFGLFLKEKEGVGLLMRMEDANVILLDQEKFSYSNGWEHLAEDIDEMILKLEQKSKVHLYDSIFFLNSHFIDEKTKDIKKPYLQKIKELVKNLNLKALGYIECHEAVVHYLEKKEELPLTAVLIELDHTNLSIFVYKRGKLTYSKVLAHTDNLIDDLLTSFGEIKGTFLLPSRIVLYNSKDLDDESTEIVTYRWSEDLFVQLPRVEVIKEHELIQGMLGVFGNQFSQKSTGTVFIDNKSQNEVLGFMIGGDVADEKLADSTNETFNIQSQLPTSFTQRRPPLILARIGDLIKRAPSFIQIFRKKWTVAVGMILVIGSLFLNEYFFHRADLTLFLPSQSVQKELTLTSDDLKIEASSETADMTDSKTTTGKKEIGEKARGSITIHNFDDKEKAFAKGTTLETGGLKFSLDQEVKVASASVVTINGGLVKQPGKAKVNATAEEIGSQSNVSSGKQFKIGDFSNSLYFGLNEGSFSGGSKKEVRTASKKDMEDLKNKVQELAKKQKREQQNKRKNSELKVIDKLAETTVREANFDKEVGEESDTLSLKAKVESTNYLYKEKELISLVNRALRDQLQKGFSLQSQRVTYTIKDAEKKGTDITLKLIGEGKAIKNVSNAEILKQVKGKNKEALETLLENNFKVQGFELKIEPDIPFLQNWMPFFSKNISLKISSL